MKKHPVHTVLTFVLSVIAVGVVGFFATSGFRFVSEHNTIQREAKISLEDYIRDGKEFPKGEYVSLEVRWVLGPYATETKTETTNGISATAGVANYYYLVLEDHTVMTLKVENAQEKATLDRMSEWLQNVSGYPMDGETLKVQGKLYAMTSTDLISLYRKYLQRTFGLSDDDPAVRYLVLDTTAGRGQLYIMIGGVAVGLALILIIRSRIKKKRERQAVPPSAETAAV